MQLLRELSSTLKYEYGLKLAIKNTQLAQKIAKRAITIYNNIRPYLNLDLNTPKYAHLNQSVDYKSYRKNNLKFSTL